MSPKTKKSVPPKKRNSLKSLISELKKRKIIKTLAAFIGGGWLILESIHLILIDHYHFSEKIFDITLITLLCCLICTLIWQWFRGAEKKPRKVKIEFILISLIVSIALFFDVSIFLQKRESDTVTTRNVKWKNSIAVLPFADMSAQKDQEYFCDGITEEIIGRLSKLRNLKVISRTSVWFFKSTPKTIREISQMLNVETILEGSVRKEIDTVRISAQLINGENGFHIWAETYDRTLARVFDIQDEIAEAIALELKGKLLSEEKDRLEKRHTDDLEAYNLYLMGRYFWNKRNEEGYRKSMEYFQQAISIDPNLALAYTGIADYYSLLGYYDYLPPHEVFPKARTAALKALEIDEDLAEAHNSLAMVKENYEWDFDAAEQAYRRAIELNPSYSTAHMWYAGFLNAMGRFEQASAEFELAKELDPLSTFVNEDRAAHLYAVRHYDDAIEQLQDILKLSPDSIMSRILLILVYTKKAMYKEATSEAKKALEIEGDSPFVQAALGTLYAFSGKKDEAIRILNELMEFSDTEYISPYFISYIHVGLGQNDQAFLNLEKAYRERSHWLVGLKVDPMLDSLRSDLRYKELLKKIGFD